jgi:hypothetical protein
MHISKKDENIIKKFFKKFGGPKGNGLPGVRFNLEDTAKKSININLVSADLYWDDSDLWSHGTWSDLAEVPLDQNDMATIDFYVYSDFEGDEHELETNLICYFDKKGLTRVWEGLDWVYIRPSAI